MRIRVEDAKLLVLTATYENLVYHAAYETFQAEDIYEHVKELIGAGYVQRLLKILADEKLVIIDQYDEHSPLNYTLSDAGLKGAEDLISLDELKLSISKAAVNEGDVPASDRIVNRSDNEDAFKKIEAELSLVAENLQRDNEVGDKLGDERDIIAAEARAAQELLRPGSFHLGRLLNLIIPALKFLSEKFASAAIGETAKKLIALLLALL